MRSLVSNRRCECEVCTGFIDIGEPILLEGSAAYHISCALEVFSEEEIERVLSQDESIGCVDEELDEE